MKKCKYCCKSEDFVDAHIIPDFMYKELYDEKHSLIHVNPYDETEKPQVVYSGEYDQNILCRNCDGELNRRYESYSSGILYGGSHVKNVVETRTSPDKNGIVLRKFKNVDYVKFKLFLLSIIWRASVSNNRFCRNVRLGPHEDIIREMLINGNPLSYEDYPVSMISNRRYEPSRELITDFNKIHKGGSTYYTIMISGILYLFYISKLNVPLFVLENTIKPTNELIMIELPSQEAFELFKKRYRS